MAEQIKINDNAYSWGSITINVGGIPVKGVTGIKYGVTQEKTNHYGIGSEPIGRGRGRKEYTGSISLRDYEMTKIAGLLSGGDITNLPPFTVVVVYHNEGSNLITTDVLQFCEFTGSSKEVSEGDTEIISDYELIVGGIIMG